jgi:hypothetical protein
MAREIDITEVFYWGVGYGQLMMEEERDMEDWADAFQGHIIGRKYSMPSAIAPRRLPKSEEWREVMRKGYKRFLSLLHDDRNKNIKNTGGKKRNTAVSEGIGILENEMIKNQENF